MSTNPADLALLQSVASAPANSIDDVIPRAAKYEVAKSHRVDYLNGRPIPSSWSLFEARDREDIIVYSLSWLGMNSHINQLTGAMGRALLIPIQ
ncbi:MAG TPA: hypothetical protein VGK24_11680 [Candidatus Angelobacter sp.]|jgi:hypothetical protein